MCVCVRACVRVCARASVSSHCFPSTFVGVESVMALKGYVVNAAGNVEQGHLVIMMLIIHLSTRIGISAMSEEALHEVEIPEAHIKGRLMDFIIPVIAHHSNIGICAELEEKFYHGSVSDSVAVITLLLFRPQQSRLVHVDSVLARACAHQSRYTILPEVIASGQIVAG